MDEQEVIEQDKMLEEGVVGPEAGGLDIAAEARNVYLIHKLAHLQVLLTLAFTEFELETGEKVDDVYITRTDSLLSSKYTWGENKAEKGVLKDRIESLRVILVKKEGE